MQKISFKHLGSVCFLVLLVFFISFINLSNNLGWGGDDAQIIAQTFSIIDKSIVNHFNQYKFIISNSVDPIGSVAYSWGLPLLLAAILKCSSTVPSIENINYIMLKLPLVLFFVGLVILLYRELLKRVPYCIAVIFTFLFALSPYLIHFTNEIMKDIPFAFLSFIAILIFNKLVSVQSLREKISLGLISALVIFLCLITRENGSIILLVFLFSGLYSIFLDIKNKTEKVKINFFVYFTTLFLSVSVFFLFSKFFPVEYIKNVFCYDLGTIIYNLKYYVNEFKLCFFDFKFCSHLYLLIIFSLLIIGIFKNYKKEIINLFFLFLISTNFIFSADQGIRYILPFLPFIFLFSALGLNSIKNLYIRNLILVSLVIPILLNLFNLVKYASSYSDYGVSSSSAKEVYQYIKENTKLNEVFIYCKPRPLHLYTGRLAFQISSHKDLLKNADYQLSVIGSDNPGPFYDKENYNFTEKVYVDEADVFLVPIYHNSNYILYKIEKNNL